MVDFQISDEMIRKTIQETLGLNKKLPNNKLDEAYVTQAKKFNLTTEFLSEKSKNAQLEILENHVENLNRVSAELDGANREAANSNNSTYRSLKIDESYNINAAFLTGLFFDNISDPKSQILMDSITYMRLERDFGTFDEWQKDFIACAMSSRDGWAVTVFNTFLNRYLNVCVDLQSTHVPFSSFPIVVLDCSAHAYFRDYLVDKKTYIYAMMKELDWDAIESRVKSADKIAKVAK